MANVTPGLPGSALAMVQPTKGDSAVRAPRSPTGREIILARRAAACRGS